MEHDMVDVTLHIDEELDSDEREALRDSFLHTRGVVAADSNAAQPHLMIIEYDPNVTNSNTILAVTKHRGLHAELIGM